MDQQRMENFYNQTADYPEMMEVVNILTEKGYEVTDINVSKDDYTPDMRMTYTYFTIFYNQALIDWMNEIEYISFKHEYTVRLKPMYIDVYWGDVNNPAHYLKTVGIIGKLKEFVEKLPKVHKLSPVL